MCVGVCLCVRKPTLREGESVYLCVRVELFPAALSGSHGQFEVKSDSGLPSGLK